MAKLRRIFRDERQECLSLFALAALSLLLFDSPLLMLLSLILEIVLTLVLLERRERGKKPLREEHSDLSFLDSFLSLVDEGWPIREAYDQSLPFLPEGERRPYDQFSERLSSSRSLCPFEAKLRFFLECDGRNEAYLLHLRSLRDAVRTRREELSRFLDEERKASFRERLTLFLFLSLTVFLSLFFPSLTVSSTHGVLSFLLLLVLSLLVPGLLVLSLARLRGWKDA